MKRLMSHGVMCIVAGDIPNAIKGHRVYGVMSHGVMCIVVVKILSHHMPCKSQGGCCMSHGVMCMSRVNETLYIFVQM